MSSFCSTCGASVASAAATCNNCQLSPAQESSAATLVTPKPIASEAEVGRLKKLSHEVSANSLWISGVSLLIFPAMSFVALFLAILGRRNRDRLAVAALVTSSIAVLITVIGWTFGV